MTSPVPAPEPRLRGRVAVLALGQLAGGVGVASGLAVGGLLAQSITGSTGLAGLPQTFSVLGAAMMAVPLARLAARRGRRPALITGFAAAAVGAAAVLAAAIIASFPLLLVGMALTGGGTAAGLQARFAAIDGVAPARHGRLLSTVVWATTIGAVAGPNLIGPGARLADAWGIPELAGPWVFAMMGLAGAVAVISIGLRGVGTGKMRGRTTSLAQALRVSVAHPSGRLALTAIATAHAVMVGIMAMTAVHLHDHGSALRIVGIVISVHVAGMFAFAPVFGYTTDRLGRRATIAAGVGILAVGAALTALSQSAASLAAQEWVAGSGLFLIGLGWSAVTIAAAALVTTVAFDRPEVEPTDVQGVADTVMGLAGAAAGALSGLGLATLGYAGLSWMGVALVAPLALLVSRPLPSIVGGDAPAPPIREETS